MLVDPEGLLGPEIDIVVEIVSLAAARLEIDFLSRVGRQVQLRIRVALVRCKGTAAERVVYGTEEHIDLWNVVRDVRLHLVTPRVGQLAKRIRDAGIGRAPLG